MKDTIYKRKTTRSFSGEVLDETTIDKIREFIPTLKPLYPEIRTASALIKSAEVECVLPWIAPDNIAIFSEECDGYLENIGFMYQQMDLFLQSMGLGVCWHGMAKYVPTDGSSAMREGIPFVIMMSFGVANGDAQRKSHMEYERKSLAQISDLEDMRLEPARLAPSGKNRQPWKFSHENNIIHVFGPEQTMEGNLDHPKIGRIDIGCALAQLYVSTPDSFEFFKTTPQTIPDGWFYAGSIKL